jgi:hypothetical protein
VEERHGLCSDPDPGAVQLLEIPVRVEEGAEPLALVSPVCQVMGHRPLDVELAAQRLPLSGAELRAVEARVGAHSQALPDLADLGQMPPERRDQPDEVPH